jgi:hypothetical protein
LPFSLATRPTKRAPTPIRTVRHTSAAMAAKPVSETRARHLDQSALIKHTCHRVLTRERGGVAVCGDRWEYKECGSRRSVGVQVPCQPPLTSRWACERMRTLTTADTRASRRYTSQVTPGQPLLDKSRHSMSEVAAASLGIARSLAMLGPHR